MRYIAIGFCFLFACQQPPRTAAVPPSAMRSLTVFTDSALYRAKCKEADTVPKLTVIPQICTPRDQRVIIR
jgi:hypothetical protein